MPRVLWIWIMVSGLWLAGCHSAEKNEPARQGAAPAPQAQAAPASDRLTTGGIPVPPEEAPPPAAQRRPAAPPPPPAAAPVLAEEQEAESKPVQPPRLNILLTVDMNVDGNYVAKFEGDFFPRILRAMRADLAEIPPIILIDGKPAKYNVVAGRSQLILQVRADGTANPQQVLVSYRVTLMRPSQTGSAFQREGENIVWKLGETRALMGKLPNAPGTGEKQ